MTDAAVAIVVTINRGKYFKRSITGLGVVTSG